MSEEKKGVSCGCSSFGIGSLIAVVMSWGVNHSWFYGFLHAICGWAYVIYWCFVHKQ